MKKNVLFVLMFWQVMQSNEQIKRKRECLSVYYIEYIIIQYTLLVCASSVSHTWRKSSFPLV